MIYDCLTKEEATLFAHYKTSHDFCTNTRLGFIFDFYNELIEKDNVFPEAPLQVGINLTDTCNLSCMHCSRKELLNSSKHNFISNWREIVDKLSDNGVIQIFLTGGEPFLHPDILDMIQYIKERKIYIAILTNGLLLTENMLNKLESMLIDDFDYIQISVDGITNTYEFMRKGAKFNQLEHRLNLISNYSIKTQIAMVLNEITYKEMFDVYKLCLKYNVDFIRYMPMFDNNTVDISQCDDSKVIKEFAKVLNDKICNKTKIDIVGDPIPLLYPFAIWLRNKYPEIYFPTGKHICPAGVTSCEISVGGDVYPCSYLENKIFWAGNIYQDSVKNLWDKQIWNCVRNRKPRSDSCIKCSESENCLGGCPASSYFRYGQFNYADGACILGG